MAYTTASRGAGQTRLTRVAGSRTVVPVVPEAEATRRRDGRLRHTRRAISTWCGRTLRKHRNAAENAAATRDVFMDVMVILSVLMFIALAAGVGLLAMPASIVSW